MTELEKKLSVILEPFIAETGLTLFSLRSFAGPYGPTVRLIVDFPRGGITLDECSELNQKVCEFLEKSGALDSGVNVEVFSPGIDSDLVTERDFIRVQGKEIMLWLSEGPQAGAYYQGILSKIDAFKREIVLTTQRGEKIFALGAIKKARQKIG